MNDAVQTDNLDEEIVITEEPAEELDLGQEAEEVPDEVEAVEEEAEDEPKQSRNQNAKQRLRRKNRELEAENERLRLQQEEKYNALEAKVDGVINPKPARPNRVDFDTEEDYEDSLYDYRQSNKSQPAEQEQARPQTQEAPRLQVSKEVHEDWLDQVDDASEKYHDFEAVAYNKEANITDTMALAIMESKRGGDIAYFLGDNPSESHRIAALGFTAQVREIDKLGAKFKKTTSAPDPVKTGKHAGDSSNKEKEDPLLAGMKFE